MHTRRWLCRAGALVFVLLVLNACATTHLPPFGATAQPLRLARDEARIWQMSAREQQKLDKSAKIYHDPLLEDYLNRVVRRLVPDEVEKEVQFTVKVIKDPSLNAFAYPNGRIYVHTGLLARMENEAQLATVLGHEAMHVINRDAVRHFRSTRNKLILANVAAIAGSIAVSAIAGNELEKGNLVTASVISQTAQVMLGLGLQLGLLAAVNGYSRSLENQADAGAMRLLVEAGYDPKEAPKVHALLLKTYGDPTKIENFFFGSHARNQERIAHYEELLHTTYAAAAQDPTRITTTAAFARRLRAVVRDNALLDIEAGRYNTAEAALERVLRQQPNDAKAHYYLGELYRRRAQNATDLIRAVEAYQQAIAHDPKLAGAYRGLGLVQYQRGHKREARTAFERYLQLQPQAKDREQIEDYLVELS